MSFKTPDIATMETVLSELENSEYRCLIDDLSVSISDTTSDDAISVSTTITFYETLVGGTIDPLVPEG